MGTEKLDVRDLSETYVLEELFTLIDEAESDERRVLLYLARRIVDLGQKTYGPIDIESDQRDWLREVNQELGDAVFYVAMTALKREVGK